MNSSPSPIAWVQLLRLPALFTAMADIFAGYLLTRGSLEAAPATLGLLLLSSSGLYLAGMVFNDVFDVEQDRRERPQRPIPSGRVTRRGAAILGSALLLIGVIAAAAIQPVDSSAGWNPLLIAGLIVAAVLFYDALAKRTWFGPLAMGACRFLNLLLGASTGDPTFGAVFAVPQLWVAAGMGVYVAGVTWFARREATKSSRASLTGGLVVVDMGLAILLAWILNGGETEQQTSAVILLGVIALTINRRSIIAVAEPSPARVQISVRTMLLSIITLGAMVSYNATGDIIPAAAIAVGLIVPAVLLGRLIPMT